MAVDARLLMSDTTPIAQGLASLGQGVSGMIGQKQQMDMNRLAGQALMGDAGAMESLTMQNPELAMGLQQRQAEQQAARQQAMKARQAQLQSELTSLAPIIASAPDINIANQRAKSTITASAYPVASELLSEDGQLDEQEWQMFKDIARQVGESGRYGAMERGMVEGREVYFQPSLTGGSPRIIEDIEPPKTASERKAEQEAVEREAKFSGFQTRARRFADLLKSPDIESATGVAGAVKGSVGRLTGSEAGRVKAGLQRLGMGMVLEAASQLSGAMSDGDIKLLKGTMPASTDDPVIWKDWYENELVPMVESRAQSAGVDVDIPQTLDVGAGTTGGASGNQPGQYTPGQILTDPDTGNRYVVGEDGEPYEID